MKIRFDFVTNSSSTSFVVICKGPLEKAVFLAAMGATKNSPLKPFLEELYGVLRMKVTNAQDAISGGYWGREKDIVTLVRKELSDITAKRAEEAIRKGKDVWIGKLDSDGGTVEAFFCCESFEIDHPRLYINALRCAW